MRHAKLALAVLMTVGAANAALAQDATSTAGPFPVRGHVPTLCSAGTLTGGDTVFDLGVLIDTSTGLLLPNLAAPSKTLTGTFCSTRSTIVVQASPLVAQNFTAAPEAGFSRTVNYTATAAGWTATPASFNTGDASNAAATQTRETAFTGDISVAVNGFYTDGGDNLRLVADTAYEGLVTVTLTAAN